ncbi:kinase-like domain-containing protein [Pisolithus orientalis]|uniref:kinase-like domain-containing protein n=1 Tax=Pisolithus orientalis TaxID=936130 RepID=UPI0022253C4B|nr:kinase-like domain-containing protein [Pisolithus orientalis]KAI6006305.1 kinase-like domain-containing protein [Pisolithus orientalis]
METNRQTSDILSAIAERARRYTINLDGQIERDPSASTRGGYGMIYRGTLLAGGRAVAVKTARGIPDIETAKRMLKEAHTWSKLEHSNILNILGITTTFDHTVSLVSPWMDGGSAYRYVQKPDRDPRPLVKDIALGLCYLHSHPDGPIIHGDLKGDNVLITSDGRAVLTDFGLSVLENSSFSMTVSREVGGSLRWMAPEMVDALSSQDPGFTVEGDIWAFGMTTLELFTRKHPYFNLTSLNAIQSRILKGPPEKPSSEDTSSRMTDEWWGVCSRCLKMAPSSRIGAVDIVKETRELPPSACVVFIMSSKLNSNYGFV